MDCPLPRRASVQGLRLGTVQNGGDVSYPIDFNLCPSILAIEPRAKNVNEICTNSLQVHVLLCTLKSEFENISLDEPL